MFLPGHYQGRINGQTRRYCTADGVWFAPWDGGAARPFEAFDELIPEAIMEPAEPLTQADIDNAPWVAYEHRPNIILQWEITKPRVFITPHDGENIYLKPGDRLATNGKLGEFDDTEQRYWKLTAAEGDGLYRRIDHKLP